MANRARRPAHRIPGRDRHGDDAFQHHFADGLLLAHTQFDFSGDGKKEKIGGAHAVDGGDEGYRDAAANFSNVVKVLHDLNQAKYRADDSDAGKQSEDRAEKLRAH